MGKFVLHVPPVMKGDSGVNCTKEYRRFLKAENPQGHATGNEKDAQRKRKWKTKEWQLKGSTDEEETQ